jgi:uncharacterized protein (DUF433 family)
MQNYLIELNSRDEPTIKSTEVTVAHILERLDSGDSIEKICIEDNLTREQVHAALSYAEMTLPQHKLNQALYPTLKDAGSEDELDYSLLTENAGYFSPHSCSLRLLHAYRKKAKRNYSAPTPV